MNHTATFVDQLRAAFRPSPRGVVGLVEDLLSLCRTHPLRIEFHDDMCHVHTDAEETVAVPVPKSVFRAALARIAALCDAADLYHGDGVIVPPDDSTGAFRVRFSNTPTEQTVDMKHVDLSAAVTGVPQTFRVVTPLTVRTPPPPGGR